MILSWQYFWKESKTIAQIVLVELVHIRMTTQMVAKYLSGLLIGESRRKINLGIYINVQLPCTGIFRIIHYI